MKVIGWPCPDTLLAESRRIRLACEAARQNARVAMTRMAATRQASEETRAQCSPPPRNQIGSSVLALRSDGPLESENYPEQNLPIFSRVPLDS